MSTKNSIFYGGQNVPLTFRGTWTPSGGSYPSTTDYPNGSVLRSADSGTVSGIYYKQDSYVSNLNGTWFPLVTYNYNDLINKPTLGSASELNASTAGTLFVTLDHTNPTQVSQALTYLGFTNFTKDFIDSVDPDGALTVLGLPTDIVSQINNKQPLDGDLTSIAGLSGTSGLLRKTAANTWTLDTNTYLTSNQTITLTGDVTGSGTTSINVSLPTTGISPGSYFLTTYDNKGRAISGSNPSTLSGFGILDAAPLSHVGSGGSAHALADGSNAGFISAANFTKLGGIQTGATANQTDAYLLNRTNHTGTQAQSTVDNLVSDLAAKQLISNLVGDLDAPSTTTYIHTSGLATILEDIIAGQNYLGEWNSSTNTPTIISSTGTEGDYYIVSVASSGVTTIDGNNVWTLGDEVLFADGVWKRKPNFQSVTSVAGKTGVVTLVKADVGLSNVDNTSDLNKPISTATQTALDLKQTISNLVQNLSSPLTTTYLSTSGLNTVLGSYALGAANSVDNEIVLFSGTSGKQLKRGSVVGNAAYATTVSSQTDTTANRLSNVAWLGLGVTDTLHSLPTYSTFAAVPTINGLTALVNANAADAPGKLPNASYRVEMIGQGSNWVQKAFARISGAVSTNEIFAWRSITSSVSYSAWRYPYDTGNVSVDIANFLAAANNSAALTALGAASSNNPTLTGNVSVPTVTKGNNSTLAASTEFVKNEGFQYAELQGISANTTLGSSAIGALYIVNGGYDVTLPLISTINASNSAGRRGKTITFSAGWTSNETVATIFASGSDLIRSLTPLADGASFTLLAGERITLSCDSSSSWYVTNWISRRPLMLDQCPTSAETNADNYTSGGTWITPLVTTLTNFPASVIASGSTRAIIKVEGNAASGIMQTVTTRIDDKRLFFRKASNSGALVGVTWTEVKTDANLPDVVSSLTDTTANKLLITGYQGIGGNAIIRANSGTPNTNFESGFVTLTTPGLVSSNSFFGFIAKSSTNYTTSFIGRANRFFGISFENGVQLTPSEFWHSNNLIKVTDYLDNTVGSVVTTGWQGLGAGSAGNNVADMTATEVNRARFFRTTNATTGGNGATTGWVSVAIDGTPSTGYLGISPDGRIRSGIKNGASVTPTYRYALDNSDLVSSTTDTTANKVSTTGWMGLGTAVTPTFSSTLQASGIFTNSSNVEFVGMRGATRAARISILAGGGTTPSISFTHYDATTGSNFYSATLYHTGNTSANVQTLLASADYAAIRTNLSLGTAALANVITSYDDETTGRVFTVGAHGLGWRQNFAEVQGYGTGAAISAQPNSFIRNVGTAGNMTTIFGVPYSSTGIKFSYNNNRGVMLFASIGLSSPRIGFVASQGDDNYIPYTEIWTDKNLVKTTSITDTTAGAVMLNGHQGLGAGGVTITDFDNLGRNFFYQAANNSVTNRPPGVNWFVGINVGAANANETAQIVIGTASDTGLHYRSRYSATPGTYNPWRKVWDTGNTSNDVQTLLGSADFASFRTNLSLGTAALANVTTSSSDTTGGRLLKVGDGGLLAKPSLQTIDFNAYAAANVYNSTGLILSDSGSTNKPSTGTFFYLQQFGYSTNKITQVAWPYRSSDGSLSYRSTFDGTTWNNWRNVWDTGNTSSDVQTMLSSANNTAILSNIGAQPLDGDLTAIAALSGTSGLARKTAANTWSLDTNTYLTANQSITLTGDATGSGTTSIAVTLAASGVTAATYGNATSVAQIAFDAKGRATSASTVAIQTATTSVPGLTTLNNATNSTSTTTAATANSVKLTMDAAVSAQTTANTAISRLDSQYNNPKQLSQALGNVSGSVSINCNLGTHITLTVTGALTLSFTNTTAAGEAQAIVLEITNGGNFGVTLPAGTRLTAGSAITFTTNGTDVLTLSKVGTANLRAYLSSKDSK